MQLVWRAESAGRLLSLVIVLGSIFAGWATPTESGAVGVIGSMLIAALNRRLTFKMLNNGWAFGGQLWRGHIPR